MAIDMRDLPLGLGSRGEGEGFASGGSKLALARRRVVDAWLDDDAAGLAGAIDQGERDFGSDLDGFASFRSAITPLADEFRARRQLARSGAERDEARSGLAATLGRLSQSVAASDDPARRDPLGREARGLIESHRAEGLLDPEDAEALAGDYDKGLGQAQAARIAREDPALAQQLLRDETLFPGLDPEMRERYAKAAEARIAAHKEPNDEGAAEIAARVTSQSRAGAALMRRLMTDRLTEGDVAAAESLGEIDAATARRLRRELEAVREAGRRLVDDLSRAESAFAEGRKLNPKDPLDRAAVDRHYELIRKGWDEAGLSPEELRPAIADYIAESGVIPSDIERKLPFYLDNGTPEQKWEAADLLQILIDRDPLPAEQILLDYRNKALGIAELVNAGHEPTQAVARYEQQHRNNSTESAVEPTPPNSGGETSDHAASRDNESIVRDPPAASGAGTSKFTELARQPSKGWAEAGSTASEDDVTKVVGSLVGDEDEASAAIKSLPPTQVAVLQFVVPLGAAATYFALVAIEDQRRRNGEPPLFKLPEISFGSGGRDGQPQQVSSGGSSGQGIGDLLKGAAADPRRDVAPNVEREPIPAPGEAVPQDLVKPPAGPAPLPEPGPLVNVPVPQTRGEQRGSPPLPIGVDGRPIDIRPDTNVSDAVGAYLSTFADIVRREDKRASPQNVEDLKRFAQLCSDYAKQAYPGLKIEHTHGSSKDGGKEYLEEKSDWYQKKDGSWTYGRGDARYSAKLPGGRERAVLFNQATTRMGGRLSTKELRAFEALRDLAGQLIVAFGKRKPNESDPQLDERLMDACKEGMRAAFGSPEKGMDED